MSNALPQRFPWRLWLAVLATLALWTTWPGGASAAPVPEATELLTRPAWARQSDLVSQQEFSLLIDKVLQARNAKRAAAAPSHGTPWISRGQAVNDLVRAFGFDARLSSVDLAQARFSDVPEAHPYRNAVLLAGQTNLVNGFPNHTFQPDEPLYWKDAATMLTILRGWTLAMPTQTPTWVAIKQEKANAWYQLFDSVRLGLTIAYGIIAIAYFVRAYKQTIRNKTRRLVTNSLMLLSMIMVLAWVNDLGLANGWFHRTLYEVGALLSLAAGYLLLRTGQTLAVAPPSAQPAPKRINVSLASVESVDHVKGEMYVVDPISKRKIMVIVTPDTKVYTRKKQDSATGYFSEIQAGDVVNIQGSTHQRGSLVSAQSLLIVTSSQSQASNAANYQLRPLYMETQASAQRQVRAVTAYR
ncbi:MAG: S-layer homology domain-containing protein [Candidatus Sericytochromatia bacterium]|nr:S-layer homology domain-containing protein [Candidatus Sericytochromatia bacterium]